MLAGMMLRRPHNTSTQQQQQYGNGIRVLLVDNDRHCPCPRPHQSLRSLLQTLQLYSYTVSVEPSASEAVSLLEKGKETYHLVMANIMDSFDANTFKLIRVAALQLGLPTLLMTDHGDYGGALARVALREGAFLCLEKPISASTIKYLWQHVLRERTRFCWEMSYNNGFVVNDNHDNNNTNDNATATPAAAVKKNQCLARNINHNHDEYSHREKKRSRDELLVYTNHHANTTGTTSGEERVLWTEELHSLFMDAIHKLGEGRCFPKEIVETMNVPNLTRMQVASHLQKCRNNDWNGPQNKKKKPKNNNNQQQPTSSQGNNGVVKKRHPPRFGAMPPVFQHDSAEESNIDVDDFLVDDLSHSPFYNEKI